DLSGVRVLQAVRTSDLFDETLAARPEGDYVRRNGIVSVPVAAGGEKNLSIQAAAALRSAKERFHMGRPGFASPLAGSPCLQTPRTSVCIHKSPAGERSGATQLPQGSRAVVPKARLRLGQSAFRPEANRPDPFAPSISLTGRHDSLQRSERR